MVQGHQESIARCCHRLVGGHHVLWLTQNRAHGPPASLMPHRRMFQFAVDAHDGSLAVHSDVVLSQCIDELLGQQGTR